MADHNPTALPRNVKNLAWAAGFLEGEGSFGHFGCPRVSAAQVQREPIDRLHSLFGGTVWHKPPVGMGKHHIWIWALPSHASVEVMMTLYILMSPKRQQEIAIALNKWKRSRLMRRPDSSMCARGHALSGHNLITVNGIYRHCRECKNMMRRIRRRKLREAS